MPLDTYAKHLAVQLTGRSKWSADKGPEGFSGRHRIELLCDLMFTGEAMWHKPLITIENVPMRRSLGLDEGRRFFSAAEIADNQGVQKLLQEFAAAREKDRDVQPTPDQKRALDLRGAVERIGMLIMRREQLAIVPPPAGAPKNSQFRFVGMMDGERGTEPVRAALIALGEAYRTGGPIAARVHDLRSAIDEAGVLEPRHASHVKMELFLNNHKPWQMAATAYIAGLIMLGFSRIGMRRLLTAAALVLVVWGVAEHITGLVLRGIILEHVPITNTYEALLWMGLVAVFAGAISQFFNRSGWYLACGLVVGGGSVLFANLVPLAQQMNMPPAVLRSNYWLTIHVVTTIASYGLLAVAAVLGHAYLIKEVLLARRERTRTPGTNALVVQTYRAMQMGVLLLTAGTILGGVWAADSWGRFWGWDPKETWALISIVVYFAMLHARYVGWLRDVGMAAAAIIGFLAIVWTFYGVNYVMATGLHSYGFGSGGERWVAMWGGIEVVFLIICKVRYDQLKSQRREIENDNGMATVAAKPA
jgi:cytochrome c-type biogenesis protein CcsB